MLIFYFCVLFVLFFESGIFICGIGLYLCVLGWDLEKFLGWLRIGLEYNS